MAGEPVIAQARPTLMPVAREHAQRLAVIRQTRPHIADGPSYAARWNQIRDSCPAALLGPGAQRASTSAAGLRLHIQADFGLSERRSSTHQPHFSL